jgi:CBS domain containing-hemolysin-like protein
MLLLGNNISLVFFGLFSADMLDPIIDGWGVSEGIKLLLQTLISTGLVLITAEFLPKGFVQINPNGYLKFTAIPMFAVYWVLYVPTQIIVSISSVFLRLLKVDSENSEKVFSKVDLEDYVQDMNSRIKQEEDFGNEMQILQNALDFDSVKARDCMVPRIDIISVELDEDINLLKQKFVDTGLSKIIVFRENIDNIIGYVHSFEMFKNPESIKQILLPISFVPEAKSGMELLRLFGENTGNIAVVVDEYGGTAGVVTIEDVIEEIFGEIEDEHDSEDLLEIKLGDNEFRFSARLEVDYVNAEYDLKITESEEFETLGGWIIYHLANIPDAGTKVEIDEYEVVVEDVSDNRVDVIRIKG